MGLMLSAVVTFGRGSGKQVVQDSVCSQGILRRYGCMLKVLLVVAVVVAVVV